MGDFLSPRKERVPARLTANVNTYLSCSGKILGFNDYGWKYALKKAGPFLILPLYVTL